MPGICKSEAGWRPALSRQLRAITVVGYDTRKHSNRRTYDSAKAESVGGC
jgi:hypothetical protein